MTTKSHQPAIDPPVLLSPREVRYPETGTGSARVILELVIDRDGYVVGARVVSGRAPFAQSAREQAKGWRFAPASRGNEAVPAKIHFLVSFEAPRSAGPAATPKPNADAPIAKPAPAALSAGEPQSAPEPVEIEVRGARRSAATGISRAEARQLPGAFGNPFRALEMFPGMTPTISGAPYFYVRGAPPNSLGYFLDDVHLPALFHVLAGPSVVHPGLIESVDFYSGAYPARYGRFAGGIAAGKLRDPSYEVHGELSVRAFDSSGLLEVPVSNRTSLTLGGRYSYANPIARLFNPDISVRFWDYQLRLSHELSTADRLTVFAFGSRDALDEERRGEHRSIFGQEFHRVDLSYRHSFEDGHLRLRSLTGWDQSLRQGGDVAVSDTLVRMRADLQHWLSDSLSLEGGLDAGHDRYAAEIREFDSVGAQAEIQQRFAPRIDSVAGAYLSFAWKAAPNVHVTPGIRSDVYHSLGTTRWGISPRLTADYQLTDSLSSVHALGLAHQPPGDALPRPGNAPPLEEGLQTALQSSAGIRWRTLDLFSLQATLFQTALFNLRDGPGVSRFADIAADIDDDTRVSGSSRGIELLLQRSFAQRLSGYVSYTLAWSQRSVERVAGPSWFDRRHVLSGAVGYRFDGGYRLGIRGSYYTGVPASVAYPEAARAPPRTPAFHRFDVRAEKRWYVGPGGAYFGLVFEMLNTTLRREVLEMSCSAHQCRSDEIGPIAIPSLGLEAFF